MLRFWLATFAAELPANETRSSLQPLALPGVREWAVEIIEEDDQYAVLFATVHNVETQPNLVCRIGFTDRSDFCNLWRARGFPLIELTIKREGDVVKVVSPFNLPLPPEGGETPLAMVYHDVLVWITGVVPGEGALATEHPEPYQQTLQAPDSVFPSQQFAIKPVTWKVQRGDVKGSGHLSVKVAPSRFPDLMPFGSEPRKSTRVWFGTSTLPEWPPDPAKADIARASRAGVFGAAAFRFEDVEVLGFRIDLNQHGSDVEEALTKLIEPLNFHLTPGADTAGWAGAVSDFKYCPATCTIMLELLRYGQMKPRKPVPPLTLHDYESQHELLVRILVGRVDDDTAQARNPATFVPAVFVDNPWSKALGRDTLGYDKRLAMFCVMHKGTLSPLRSDGRLSADEEPEPLGSIKEIHLSRITGKDPAGETLLLKLDCPYQDFDDWGTFDEIDPDLAWGAFPLAPIRWQQSDFDKREFRRSFALSVTTKTFKGFDSIQASPIGERRLHEEMPGQKTWITSRFAIDDGAQIARPSGIVELTLCANQAAPEAWCEILCKMLGIAPGESGTISLPSGSWYRMRCSMDLTVDDGL